MYEIKPKTTIVALIYRSPYFAWQFYKRLKRACPEILNGDAIFYFVANNAHFLTLTFLRFFQIPHIRFKFKNPTLEQMISRKIANPSYLSSVYAAYNFGISQSRTENVLLLNSDMIMSANFLRIMENALQDSVISARLVERNHTKYGVFPGAIERNLGSSFYNFDDQGWNAICNSNPVGEYLENGPYMPSIFKKEWFQAYGYFHHGNLGDGIDPNNVINYGDRDFFERLARVGIHHKSLSSVLCYHFKEGEMEHRFKKLIFYYFGRRD